MWPEAFEEFRFYGDYDRRHFLEGSWFTDGPSDCDALEKRVKEVVGRLKEVLRTSGVNIVGEQFFHNDRLVRVMLLAQL